MDGYTVKGHLSAHLIRNLTECLRGVTVKIYSPFLAVANGEIFVQKEPLQCLTDKEILAKETSFLGVSDVDVEGNYHVQLSEDYKGGPLEIDLKVEQVPFQKYPAEKGPQFTLRRLSPIWREENEEFSYRFDNCIPFAFWSGVRRQCDAWVICGFVKTSCDAKKPLCQVSVTAYDSDWDNDDVLGTSLTDDTGFFRIDYSSKDYTKTILSPLINIDTPISLMSGPGVYFEVTDKKGHLLHRESRKMGRSGKRKHVSHCFYEDVFVNMDVESLNSLGSV